MGARHHPTHPAHFPVSHLGSTAWDLGCGCTSSSYPPRLLPCVSFGIHGLGFRVCVHVIILPTHQVQFPSRVQLCEFRIDPEDEVSPALRNQLSVERVVVELLPSPRRQSFKRKLSKTLQIQEPCRKMTRHEYVNSPTPYEEY